jgi:ketosteroid isomerase-like protein
MRQNHGNRVAIPSEVRIVQAWHEALNTGDVDFLATLSHPDIEVGGPRGVGRGVQLLCEWVDRANIHLDPGRVFHRVDTVVVEQEAAWRSADTGQVSGSQIVASVFIVREDQIARVVRYPDLADALCAVNLDESYEIRTD